MNKEEALDFMGLQEPATKEAIMDRFKERYNYFQMLYSNAPNKIIENIQQQNLEKLDRARKALLENLSAKQNLQEKKFYSPALEELGPVDRATTGNEVIAWLIVHTENRRTETFNLYEGENYIGRKINKELPHFIVVEDTFISRTHALIKCEFINGKLVVDLYDGDGYKPSANGVYLNGQESRINRRCYLKDGDTIQLGNTKLVLKVNKDNSSISNKIAEVQNTSFIRTIAINR